MRILMLGNSFTATNHLPELLAATTGAEVVAHTRGGARLAEQLNPATKMGALTQEALQNQHWDYVVLQEMSHGPITAREKFRASTARLCEQIRQSGAKPVLYATWAYQQGGARLAALGLSYEQMSCQLSDVYRQAAEQNHALLADVGEQFRKAVQPQALYAADGVHPNAEGTRLAVRTLADTILQDAAGALH